MEIKDCTFKPQILKKNNFRNKRVSTSVMGLTRLDPNGDVDPYFVNRKVVENDQRPESSIVKTISPSRHEKLYQQQQLYAQKKMLKEQEIQTEREKGLTFKPTLYKSKIVPRSGMDYQNYKKRHQSICQQPSIQKSPVKKHNFVGNKKQPS